MNDLYRYEREQERAARHEAEVEQRKRDILESFDDSVTEDAFDDIHLGEALLCKEGDLFGDLCDLLLHRTQKERQRFCEKLETWAHEHLEEMIERDLKR